MPDLKKAELVEGVVYMPSPVSATHANSHGQVVTWLGVYSARTPGVHLGDNATVRLDLDNEVQPDAFLRIGEAHGGHSRVSGDGFIDGAPELVVEVALSGAAYDLHDKLRAYRRSGVGEYIVLQLQERRLDWFRLEEGEYKHLSADAAGLIRRRVFPGLQLDAQALLAGDLAAVLAAQQAGVQSTAHGDFAAQLAGA